MPAVTKPGVLVAVVPMVTAIARSSLVAHTTEDTATHQAPEADLSLSSCRLAYCVLRGNVTRGAVAISSLCESCVPLDGFPWSASASNAPSLLRAGGSLPDDLGLHHGGGGCLDNWFQSPLRQV